MGLQSALGSDFDWNGPTADDRTLLPPGRYVLEIKDAEIKDTRNQDGKYLAITHEVIEPEDHSGRLVWKNINIDNPNTKAVEIGYKELRSLARATGLALIDEPEELIGKTVEADLDIEKGKGDYGDQNRIKQYVINGDPAPKSAPAKPAPAKPAASEAPRRPWQKK